MDQAPIRVTADGLTMVGVDQHRDYLESVRYGRRRIIRFEAGPPMRMVAFASFGEARSRKPERSSPGPPAIWHRHDGRGAPRRRPVGSVHRVAHGLCERPTSGRGNEPRRATGPGSASTLKGPPRAMTLASG